MNFKEFRETQGRKYFPNAAAVFALFVVCILLFFLVFRFQAVRSGVATVMSILAPFFYGAAFAYLLRPMCKYFARNFERRLRPRVASSQRAAGIANGLSVMVSLVLVLSAVFLLLTLTLQSVFNSIVDLTMMLPGQIEELTAWLEGIFADNEVALNYIHNLSDSLNTWASDFFGKELLPNLQEILNGVSAGAVTILTELVNLFIGLIVAIYLLASRSKWRAQLKMVLRCLFSDKAYAAVVKELRFIDRTFTDYISGRILDSVIVGVIVYVACLIMGLPDAALIAVVNGITNIIPYFGPYIGAIPSALLIFMDDPVKCVWFIIFMVILQQVDGNIICPKILSGKVGLSSFWVLFSTLLFGGLFGFVGLLIGVPVFVVFYDLIKKAIYWALGKRGHEELIECYEDTYHPPVQEEKNRPAFLRAKEIKKSQGSVEQKEGKSK